MTRNEKRIRELAVVSAYSIGDVNKGVNYIMQLYERNKERKLYRFRPPRSYEITALKDDKIYLCRPSVYEDNGDCEVLYEWDSILEYYMKELNSEIYARDDYEEHKEEIIEKLKSHPKILKIKDEIRDQCLVAYITDKNGENIWKNYAQNG